MFKGEGMKRIASGIVLMLLLMAMFSLALHIKSTKAEWTGTVYIRADGSIDPPDAPIITYDNITYTLTGNIVSTGDGIVVEKGDITLNGSGYTIQGPSGGSGVNIKDVDNITIRDCHIIFFQKGIYLLNSHNNKVIGSSLFGNEYGIYLVSSLNNSIVKNNMFENFWSIWLYASLHNTIFRNRVSEGFGIVFNLSSNNSVLENEILRYRVPGEYGCYGIWFEHSSNNAIMKNTIGYTFIVGAYLYNSSNNIVTENNIMENGFGIDIRASSNNKIFHNNFVNNLIQVYSREGSVNTWDDDYPSGGNYWSDYAGIDLYSGPYQNETGSDGIGDTPYVIDANNIDHYPLMNPYTPTPPKPPIITATVDIQPQALNLRSIGKWITVYIELPEGYDVSNIHVSTIMLNDTIPVQPKPIAIGDYDNDTVPDLMVKFDRQQVIKYIMANVDMSRLYEERFMTITLTVTGKLNDGTPFQGSDTVKIILPMPKCWRLLAKLGVYPF
jgi:parallel beta-helix repeat protein